MAVYKLYPVCKDYIWGGTKLKEKYGKTTDKSLCAESWELSFHKDGLTEIAGGKTLAETLTDKEKGENCKGFPFFPVLIKFIDAKDNLSVQVHPSDEYALKNENSFGKTEMWYIAEAEEGAGIYCGFKKDTDKDEFVRKLADGTVEDLLNFIPVKRGESYFIKAGTVHAIGKGCLICEIQQNSNLTYRVYDYNRKDKNGKCRELHVDKALRVADFTPYKRRVLSGDALGIGKYFSVRKLCVNDEVLKPEKSFQCITCVRGKGEIDGQPVSAGDSFFVSADNGEYTLKGDNMEVILTEIRKYYVGIDLGGTFIKGGIVDDLGNVLLRDMIPTEREYGAQHIADNISKLCKQMLENADMSASDVVGIGVGVPGMVDGEQGKIVYSNNIDVKDFYIAKEIEKQTGLAVKIANDANVAVLGETRFGCAKGYSDTVMVTLGTGVGSGIVIGGKLFEGNRSAGAELGHTVIAVDGEPCTCGRKGCLEAYVSATALIRDTKRVMTADKNCKMWEIGSLDAVNGKTAFDYADKDASAKAVVDNYIEKLGIGITNIANAFRPEAVILGGGVCAQGDKLIAPLQKYVDSHVFGGDKGPRVKILTATLGNGAGLLGAATLWLDRP